MADLRGRPRHGEGHDWILRAVGVVIGAGDRRDRGAPAATRRLYSDRHV